MVRSGWTMWVGNGPATVSSSSPTMAGGGGREKEGVARWQRPRGPIYKLEEFEAKQTHTEEVYSGQGRSTVKWRPAGAALCKMEAWRAPQWLGTRVIERRGKRGVVWRKTVGGRGPDGHVRRPRTPAAYGHAARQSRGEREDTSCFEISKFSGTSLKTKIFSNLRGSNETLFNTKVV